MLRLTGKLIHLRGEAADATPIRGRRPLRIVPPQFFLHLSKTTVLDKQIRVWLEDSIF